MLRKLVPAQVSSLGDDEVEVILSTAALARDGHILIPQGCITDNYLRNPVWFADHLADTANLVANSESLTVNADNISARVRFVPLGVSRKADEVRGLVKSGFLRSVSIGFEPLDGTPLDPKHPRGGQRITKWELLECSFVGVPADTGAIVTARSNPKKENGMTQARRARAKTRTVQPKFVRGLYDVANLAYLLTQLGYAHDDAAWETACEGDGSKVPGMLGEALVSLGEAFIAMATEETNELLAGHDLELDDDSADVVLSVEARAHIAAAPSAKVRAWRRAFAHAKQRGGKTLSEDTVRCLRDAQDAHEEALEHTRAATRAHKRGVKAVDDLMERAGVPGDETDDSAETDDNSTDVQTSDGTAADEGARSSDYRRRQADRLKLAAA